MKKVIIFFFLCFSIFVNAHAQDTKFTVTVSTDSVLMNNYFQVSFTLENAQGQEFEAPTFEEFNVISGPNMSTSISMMNGQMLQSVTYAYYLEPKDIGNYYIQPASIKTGDTYLETAPLEIAVVPNPDGIKQMPQQRQPLQSPFGNMEDFFNRNDFFNQDFFRSEGFPDMSDFFQQMPQFPVQPKAEEETPNMKKKKRKTYRL